MPVQWRNLASATERAQFWFKTTMYITFVTIYHVILVAMYMWSHMGAFIRSFQRYSTEAMQKTTRCKRWISSQRRTGHVTRYIVFDSVTRRSESQSSLASGWAANSGSRQRPNQSSLWIGANCYNHITYQMFFAKNITCYSHFVVFVCFYLRTQKLVQQLKHKDKTKNPYRD